MNKILKKYGVIGEDLLFDKNTATNAIIRALDLGLALVAVINQDSSSGDLWVRVFGETKPFCQMSDGERSANITLAHMLLQSMLWGGINANIVGKEEHTVSLSH